MVWVEQTGVQVTDILNARADYKCRGGAFCDSLFAQTERHFKRAPALIAFPPFHLPSSSNRTDSAYRNGGQGLFGKEKPCQST